MGGARLADPRSEKAEYLCAGGFPGVGCFRALIGGATEFWNTCPSRADAGVRLQEPRNQEAEAEETTQEAKLLQSQSSCGIILQWGNWVDFSYAGMCFRGLWVVPHQQMKILKA
ncbi:leptin receptor gene-related protein isoform X2 [Loxodonta africana]|uniref:leptin receptor gene-related protein isoform X2 n=1 Tax=Loxodonta africana TaxID=9785 RepID=UPI0030CCD807